MLVKLNSLFGVGVESDGNGGFVYELYDDVDEVVYSEHAGSAWTSSEESMIRIGNHLMTEYLRNTNQYVMYAMTINYNGWLEIKWWMEREARDTSLEFARAINRPEMWGMLGFEFLINRDDKLVHLDTKAVLAYAKIVKERK